MLWKEHKVGEVVYTVFDLQSQSRKGALQSSGIILIQIHTENSLIWAGQEFSLLCAHIVI